eukprot:14847461-Alexandrium_andersonii.AAC.1
MASLYRSSMAIPSPATICRARLLLDAAMQLERHRLPHWSEFIRFGLADSSPQKRRDWLLSCYDEIDVRNLVPAFEAVTLLARGGVDASRWDDLHATLLGSIRRHNSIPTALASGNTSLVHKVQRLVYSWSLGRCTGDINESLARFLASFFGFCSDLGVELGTA